MFNLFVTSRDGTWDGSPYEYLLARALTEHTKKRLTERYSIFDDAAIKELMSFPCLFVYENGNNNPAQIGWLTRIRTRAREIRVEYLIESSLPTIQNKALEALGWDLDIDSGELNRTHWALKDAELFPVLIEAGLIKEDTINGYAPDSKVISLGLHKAVSDIIAQPTVFRLPTAPRRTDLVSVMMPFTPVFDGVFSAVATACRGAKMNCQKANDIWDASEVIQDIFSLIYQSKIVVCDFSSRNPNVFYEAGIAHTLGRPVIPIAQHESDVPFDLRHHRYIAYLNNAEGLAALSEKLLARIKTLARA